MIGRYETPSTGPVGATGATGATGAAGEAGAVGPAWTEIRLCDLAAATTLTSTAGTLPIGALYYGTTELTIASLNFRWKRTAASETVRVSIWDASAVRLGYADVVCGSDGLFTATLGTPIVIAAYTTFTCSTWETSNSRYCSFASGTSTIVLPNGLDVGLYLGSNLVLADAGKYGALGGDICPTTAWGLGSGNATVSPIVTF